MLYLLFLSAKVIRNCFSCKKTTTTTPHFLKISSCTARADSRWNRTFTSLLGPERPAILQQLLCNIITTTLQHCSRIVLSSLPQPSWSTLQPILTLLYYVFLSFCLSGELLFFCPFWAFLLLHLCPQGDALGWHTVAPSGRWEPNVQADMLSAWVEDPPPTPFFDKRSDFVDYPS